VEAICTEKKRVLKMMKLLRIQINERGLSEDGERMYCTVTKIYCRKRRIPWLLEEVGGAVPELA
jgi:hypothetical protein